jgi:hypothetical protein
LTYSVVEGTPPYDLFMLAAQTIVDDADFANYSIAIGAGSLPLLEIEEVGDGSSIVTALLADTEPFIFSTGSAGYRCHRVSRRNSQYYEILKVCFSYLWTYNCYLHKMKYGFPRTSWKSNNRVHLSDVL